MQIISFKTVRSDNVQDLKDLKSQSLATRAKEGEKLDSLMRAIKNFFNLIGDNILELSTENKILKKKVPVIKNGWSYLKKGV